jgi:methylated-DNA-[protein]-cysteine S-methyltransferase
MSQAQMKIHTKIGDLFLIASEHGLREVNFKEKKIPYATGKKDPSYIMLQYAALQLKEYFDGKRKDFDIPLEITRGTEFQKSVWKELSKIKYGETCSYKDLAAAIGNEKACRAVGSANGKNPITIIIPCHRVIAHDSTLGGYGGGLNRKSVLLDLEKQYG